MGDWHRDKCFSGAVFLLNIDSFDTSSHKSVTSLLYCYLHSSKFLLKEQDRLGHFSIKDVLYIKPACNTLSSNPCYDLQGFPMELTPRGIPCCIVRIFEECIIILCVNIVPSRLYFLVVRVYGNLPHIFCCLDTLQLTQEKKKKISWSVFYGVYQKGCLRVHPLNGLYFTFQFFTCVGSTFIVNFIYSTWLAFDLKNFFLPLVRRRVQSTCLSVTMWLVHLSVHQYFPSLSKAVHIFTVLKGALLRTKKVYVWA